VDFRNIGSAVIVARAWSGGPAGENTFFTAGRCYSACVYALLGAKKRVIPVQSLLGIHRMYTFETVSDAEGSSEVERVSEPTDLVSKLSDYAAEMGVSRDLITTAEKISPDKIHIVTASELRRWHVGTRNF
jgi:hypothetical protein